MSLILDGKLVSNYVKENVKKEVDAIIENGGKAPKLAVVLVGEDPASKIYVRNKIRACAKTGIESISVVLDESISEEELISKIDELAKDEEVTGILLQLPLPKHLNKDNVLPHIPEFKDVDGLTKNNAANLVMNQKGIVPCTPQGVIDLLKYYNIDVASKNVTIIGRSNLVGKPLSLLMTNLNATVTLCHSKTKNIADITRRADIVVCALGKANFLTKDMVNENSIVVDVGINRVDDKVVGDADFENLNGYVSAITPVPGGCGPMTVAELMVNTINCYKIQKDEWWTWKI